MIEFGGEPGERGTWTPSEKYEVNRAAIRIGKNLANLYNEYMFGLQAELSDHFAGNDYLMSLFNCGSDLRPLSIRQAFLLYYGKPALFYKTGRVETYYGEYKGAYSNNENEIGWPTPRINVNKYNYRGDIGYRFDRVDYGYRWATHELGHYFEARINDILGTNHVRDQLSPEIQNRHGFADDYPGWQQSTCNDPGVCKGEIFADMFLGWNYNKWATRPGSGIPTDDAVLKSEFMDQNMAPWIALVINRERGNR